MYQYIFSLFLSSFFMKIFFPIVFFDIFTLRPLLPSYPPNFMSFPLKVNK